MYKPIVIIGAPRSGTNMLRDLLCSLDGVGTWPCDEINYIWRHGNMHENSDEFTADMATQPIIDYIRKQVDSLANTDKLDFVVEKTCANSLRVNFVEKILPDAHYIFIVRNGFDVVASAKLRWTAKLDIPYLIKKVKYVPFVDLPFYASRYLWSRIYRVFSKEKRLAFWGPQLKNMDNIVATHSLIETCALQWKRCVESSQNDFKDISQNRITMVNYEEFVTYPEKELRKILDEVGIPINDTSISQLVSKVSKESIHKWKVQLDSNTIELIKPIIDSTIIKPQ